MGNLWDKPGVPHKGWTCIDVIDRRADGLPVEESDYATCEMCGHEQIRFVHIMEHDEYGQLEVGCVCAQKMSNDYVNPRHRETKLKNRAARKTKWLKRKWRTSAKGNSFVNAEGHNLVVFPAKFKPGRWSFGIDGDFSRATFATESEAKLAMFDEFWQLIDDDE
ncbi:MAG: hypothetical protein WD768_01665 [Phycisphaeraceae bacterium]